MVNLGGILIKLVQLKRNFSTAFIVILIFFFYTNNGFQVLISQTKIRTLGVII